MPKQSKPKNLYLFSLLNKQTDLTGQHNFLLFYFVLHVADPATFLASNSGLGTLFSSENSLFIQIWRGNITFFLISFSITS